VSVDQNLSVAGGLDSETKMLSDNSHLSVSWSACFSKLSKSLRLSVLIQYLNIIRYTVMFQHHKVFTLVFNSGMYAESPRPRYRRRWLHRLKPCEPPR
jgi:hypothetical protein